MTTATLSADRSTTIWFLQVKRALLDTPFGIGDQALLMAILMFYLDHHDATPFVDAPEMGVTIERGQELGWLTREGKLNKRYFANSREDRDFRSRFGEYR